MQANLSVEGNLLGVMRDAAGRLLILTQATIPFAPLYQGVFSTPVDKDGVAGDPVFRFVVETGERLIGRPIAHDSNVWMPEALFSPSEGAERLYVREFD